MLPRYTRPWIALLASEWLLAPLVVALVVYLPALWGVFVFDDYPWILQNHRMDPFDLGQRRPVALLTFAANLRTTGANPVPFHLVNIALHLVNGALVYLVIARTVPLAERLSWIASAGTAIFLLHPAQTGAVTYVSGRATSLMTCWLLVAHLAAMRGLEGRTIRRTAVSLGAFALAVGSKEMALVYPAIWIGWLVFNEGIRLRDSVRVAAPQLMMAVLLVGGMMVHPGYRSLLVEAAASGQLSTTSTGKIEQRVGLGFCFNDDKPRDESCIARRVEGIARLARFLVSPWTISIDPGRRAAGLADLLIVALACLVAVIGMRTGPGAGAAGMVWLVAALVPTHVILVRSDPASDRLLYLPMVGVAFGVSAFAGALARLRVTHVARSLCATAAFAVLCAAAAGTWHRNTQYQSEIALWEDAVAKNTRNLRAHVNLAYGYELQGNFDKAESQYRRALAVRPNVYEAEHGLERVARKREERIWR
jgi:hypothetical protein